MLLFSHPVKSNSFATPWNGLFEVRILEWVAFPSPGYLPNPGIEPKSPALQVDSLPLSHQGSPQDTNVHLFSQKSLCLQTHQFEFSTADTSVWIQYLLHQRPGWEILQDTDSKGHDSLVGTSRLALQIPQMPWGVSSKHRSCGLVLQPRAGKLRACSKG